MNKFNNESESVLINLRIDEDLRTKFRIKTIKEKTTMTDIILNFIKKYVEE